MALLERIEPVPEVLAHPHGLLEGPRFGAGGELVYSDVIAGGVWARARDGTLRELVPKRRGVGGIVPHSDGGWVLSGRSLLHLQAGGGQLELPSEDDVCGYNDIFTTRDGGLIAGVLTFRPFAGEQPRAGRIVLLDVAGGARVLCDEVIWANGIGIAPDGETVFVSDYARKLVLVLSLAREGVQRELPVPEGSPDGLAVDSEGGVWVALAEAGAIARMDADGHVHELVEVPASFVSSLSFGGADMRDVLITTADNTVSPELGGTLLRARSAVPGLPVTPARV